MRHLTLHARKRSQQRAISPIVINLLFAYGETSKTGGGEIYHFTSRVVRRLRFLASSDTVRVVQENRNCYLVECEGRVVTVGHRHKRIRNM